MNNKFRLLAIGIACVCGGFPQVSMAEDVFKSSTFLTWERDNQEFYIRTSIGMAGFIVGQTSKKQQKCLENWYVADMNVANEHIFSTMRRFPDYHPRGVIVAVMEKKCGEFKYTE